MDRNTRGPQSPDTNSIERTGRSVAGYASFRRNHGTTHARYVCRLSGHSNVVPWPESPACSVHRGTFPVEHPTSLFH